MGQVTTNWKFCTDGASVDRDLKSAWTQPTRITADDNQDASCDIPAEDYSDWLRATEFDFDGAGADGVPADAASIDGIEVEYEVWAEASVGTDDSVVKLRLVGGQAGDNKASAVDWGTSRETRTFGGSADDWNAGFTAANVRTAGFGIDLSVANAYGVARLAYVDYCKMRITYTEAVVEGHRRGSFFKMF